MSQSIEFRVSFPIADRRTGVRIVSIPAAQPGESRPLTERLREAMSVSLEREPVANAAVRLAHFTQLHREFSIRSSVWPKGNTRSTTSTRGSLKYALSPTRVA